MKAQSIGNFKTATEGFATLEILLSFTILILCISAVIMVTFGNQSIAVDSEISNEAISKAQALLEKARADSRQDFNLVNPYILTETSGPLIFTKKLDVIQNDLFTKEVTSTVSWQTGEKKLSTIFTTLLTNREAENGGDTCSSLLTGDWKNPEIESTINFSSISPTGKYLLTDLDAYKGKLYVTVNKTTSKSDPTLFVFDVNDSINPTLLGKADNASNVTSGLNAVRVSENTITNKIYAYAASNTSSDYSSCDPIDSTTHVVNPACGQLYIFDVTNGSPIMNANLKIASTPSISGQNTGTSLFYKNGYLFLGLSANSSGPEFNILDVHQPDLIQSGPYTPLGSLEIGNGVNAIVIRDNYAYIASPNSEELQILDISSLNNPILINSFNSPIGAGNGKSIYLVGSKLYLGKTNGAGSDFHILDDTSPTDTLTSLGRIDVGSSNSVNKVIVRDYLSFLLTNKDLEIFDTSDPVNIKPWGTFTLPGAYDSSKPEPSMDCEGNRIFISSNNDGGQGYIYIIKPGK